jgi:MFS family permease
MRHYSQNIRWLLWFTPFRSMSIGEAYIAPFFVEHGLSTSEIFLLQSIFSTAYLLWEIPSGMIADRLGRAASIKISAPIAAVAMIAYGLSSQFWQFVVCELLLALANGLISGVDTALMYDSLKADGREMEYTRAQQRMDGLRFASTAAAFPVAMALAYFVGVGSTIVADGLMVVLGIGFAMKLVEAPRSNGSQEKRHAPAWKALGQLVSNRKVRWLITLRSALNAATYMGYWLSALYYQHLGIAVVWFGAILAARSAWKAWLSHRVHQRSHIERNMVLYATLLIGVYLAMATGLPWLLLAVLGHDVVQALGTSPLTHRLNDHMGEEHRATLNSVANLIQRLVYAVTGPLVGLAVDKWGLSLGMIATGVICSSIALLAIARLRPLNALA